MTNKYDFAWNLFLELRKEILESQKIRTQIVGFKIAFVSAAIATVGALYEHDIGLPPVLFAIPAFAAIFFDLLISSYSFSIKRLGYYCRQYLEPLCKDSCGWPSAFPLWEEFLQNPKVNQKAPLFGHFGMTLLAVLPAYYGLLYLTHTEISIGLAILLSLFLIYDVIAFINRIRFSKDEIEKGKSSRAQAA
jgi:hypothetical protein